MQTELSIIICAHNEERHIAECIESLHLADHPQWEAIIINDASTDATLDVIELFAQKHINLRCYSLTHNMGTGNARNFAIMLAKGEYIAFLDHENNASSPTVQYWKHGANHNLFEQQYFRKVDQGSSAFLCGQAKGFSSSLTPFISLYINSIEPTFSALTAIS
jgi:glycosyltransferase involved in cell wall biosynthesis